MGSLSASFLNKTDVIYSIGTATDHKPDFMCISDLFVLYMETASKIGSLKLLVMTKDKNIDNYEYIDTWILRI